MAHILMVERKRTKYLSLIQLRSKFLNAVENTFLKKEGQFKSSNARKLL